MGGSGGRDVLDVLIVQAESSQECGLFYKLAVEPDYWYLEKCFSHSGAIEPAGGLAITKTNDHVL